MTWEITGSNGTSMIKVLLIEDNEVDAWMIRKYLLDASRKEEGFTSTTFHLIWKNSLSSGLDFLAQEDVDAVLLDLNLSDSFGLNIFFQIHQKKTKIPILILTGLSDRELATRAVREGAQDYLIKGELDGRLLDRSIRYSIERNRAQKALLESKKKYRTLINNANESIIVAQDGLLKFVNPMTLKLLEDYSEQELVDRPFTKFIHPDDRSMVVENYRRRIPNEAALPRYAFQVVTRAGIVKWVEIHADLIEWQGKPASLNFLTDITESKRAEEALAFTYIILRTQQELSIDGILVVDGNGKILSYNRRFVDMWGIASDIIESQSDERALQSVIDKLASPEQFLQKVKQIYEYRDKTSSDEVILKDGRSFDRYSAPMVGASGKYYGKVWYFRDITERKHAEEVRERLVTELESKNTEMERFIYTVSHDLRSPLVTINGFLGFLESDLAKGDSERVKVDLKMISSAITRMETLLKDTLELSRIGRVAHPPDTVPFIEIIQEALDQVSEKLMQRGFVVSIQPDLPFVSVDRMRIFEVLINLMENSIKYIGDQPHPSLQLGCRLDGEETVFFVKDNGIGIDPSQHDKVFELFYKVDKKMEGSGAGLAIIKRIIEVHGGRIWIKSELGKGCTVCFIVNCISFYN
jgi:PAS domain S-box-containing protein